MKAAPFDYHAAQTTEEAVALLADLGDEARVLAGGQSLIPMLALRLAVFEHLVDVGRIDALQGIEPRHGVVRIMAATTDRAIEHSAVVAGSVPLLARATPLVGHFQIRNRGTLGGSIAHADPAAEFPAVALALDAEIEALSTRGLRNIAASDFFTGLWSTALAPDELLVAMSFPVWSGRCGFAVEEFARRHGDFAIAGAAVALELDGEDRVLRCAIGLMGLGAAPMRAVEVEGHLLGRVVTAQDAEVAGRDAMDACADVISDLNGSVKFRKRVGAVMVKRALIAAVSDAQCA